LYNANVRRLGCWILGVIWLSYTPLTGNSLPAVAVEEVLSDPQGIANLKVLLSSAGYAISAVQFDLQLPEAAFATSITPDTMVVAAQKSLHFLEAPPRLMRILISGLNQSPLADGVIATLAVQMRAGAPAGRHAISMGNVILSNRSGNAVFADGVEGAVVVGGGPAYVPTISSVVNAASYASGPVAPGEVVVIQGNWLAAGGTTMMELRQDGVVSTSLAGTRAFFDGIPAPIVYSTATQVSAIVPYGIDGRAETVMELEYLGSRSAAVRVKVGRSAPAIFTADSSGRGQAAAINPDGTLNGSGRPVARGAVLEIYGTGEGQTTPSGSDGMIVASGSSLRRPIIPVTATVDGRPAQVVYAGSAGGQVSGLLQVNVRIPETAGKGPSIPVTLTIGDSSSQPGVTIAVQ
jgi:uncharacterized protein (TIGR03437 family)